MWLDKYNITSERNFSMLIQYRFKPTSHSRVKCNTRWTSIESTKFAREHHCSLSCWVRNLAVTHIYVIMYISALASDFYSQVGNTHFNVSLDQDGLLGLTSTRNVDLYLYHSYKHTIPFWLQSWWLFVQIVHIALRVLAPFWSHTNDTIHASHTAKGDR